jgi:glycosyltransferase involved in cell wall biosynthesis
MLQEIELTILMPCLNEAETIEVCVSKAIRYLRDHSINGEVLVSDNGSSDGSREIAERAGARVVTALPKGYGSALLNGIGMARGTYIIMGDADDSYDFSNLDEFVKRLRDGADLVMGNRFTGGIMPGAMPPLHRWVGNPVLSTIGRVFFKSTIGDFHCGLRGFRKSSIQQLNLISTGMEFASEMVVKATTMGLRVEEAPTTLHPDGRSRRPHLRTWRDGWRHLRFMLLYSPRWLFLYPGLILSGIGLAVSARLSTGSMAVGNVVFDINTLLVGVATGVIGYQSLWFAILSRAFASREGLLLPERRVRRFRDSLSLERLIPLSFGLFLVGLAGLIFATGQWRSSNWGKLDPVSSLRLVIPSVGVMVIAAQTALGSALLSVFSIGKPTTDEMRTQASI